MSKPSQRSIKVVDHPLYKRWTFMRHACSNPNHPDWKSYGGRGIKVGDEFTEFWDFADLIEYKLGMPPNGHLSKLARKDQDGDYTIKNVMWDNAKNVGRRCLKAYKLTYKRKNLSLREWSEITGINFHTINSRIEAGWTPAQTLGYQPGPRAKRTAKKKQ